MTDILDDLRNVQELRGDTYSSAEVLGMVGRAADEIERLRAEIERLRDMYARQEKRHDEEVANMQKHTDLAEAEIERQREATIRVIERLKLAEAEIERLQDHHARNLGWEKRAMAAETEIEQFTAALREIDDLAVRHEKGAIGKAQKIARAALEGK